MAELVGPAAGHEVGDRLADGAGQRPQQPGADRLLQPVGELVEGGGLRVELGQHRFGVDRRAAHPVGHQHRADGGEGGSEGEQQRVHQMSILTMRMIIPIPMETDTAAPMRAMSPEPWNIGSR